MTPRRLGPCRRRGRCGAVGWALACIALALGAGPARAGQTIDERVLQLEAQVRGLIERVRALEGGAPAPDSAADQAASGAASGADDGVVWTFDDPVDGSPLKVSYKSLDRQTGQVDLLVQVTAPLADDPVAWAARPPLRVTLRTADGSGTTAALVLARAGRLDPGAHLHLRATVDPAQAAAARQLIVGGAD